MGVDVRRGLVVGVAHDLHGDQRVDTGFVEQRHAVVAEVVRRDHALQVGDGIVDAMRMLLLLPLGREAAGLYVRGFSNKTFVFLLPKAAK